jgi:hypothetical protein
MPRRRRGEGISRAAQATAEMARRNVMLFARLAEVGVVKTINPLTVEIAESGMGPEAGGDSLVVGEDGLTLGSNVRKYDQEHQLKPGDSIAMVQLAAQDFLALDVITDKEVARGAHTEFLPSADWKLRDSLGGNVTFTSSVVIGKLRVFDELGVVIGWIPVFNHLPGAEPPWPPTP